jgi:hypothetical protein
MCGMGKHGQVKRRDRQINGMQIQACLDKFDLNQFNNFMFWSFDLPGDRTMASFFFLKMSFSLSGG